MYLIPYTKANAVVLLFCNENNKGAFPFSTFGELKGKVLNVSADSKEPDEITNFYSFPVTIGIDRNFLMANDVKIPLRSGMSIQVNMKLRDKPIISLISDLLIDKTDSIRAIRQ